MSASTAERVFSEDFLLYVLFSFQILHENVTLSNLVLYRIVSQSCAQLLAKGRNVDTDGITEAVYTAVPDMFNQFFRADDTILVEHKILQQSTFLSGEREFFTINVCFSGAGVKADVAALQADILLNKSAPGQAADTCFQFLKMKWFCQIIVCSKVKSFYFILNLATG